MDAAQADVASGTRQRRSVKRMLFPKAPHSGIISRQKARVPRATAIEPPLVGRVRGATRKTANVKRTKPLQK
ncbi:hypothetical protein EXT73_13295 [Pectobacterium atrosepticum]|nr:hypothetical protein EV46_15785 [Pectobacterium atrosepticum]ATY91754.1 hypothetical protein CVS35_15980 [Pectobacterium atrosepticum]MCL6391434.1 hypothetical protein [Pectobacterium atrosepticum]PWD57506.1 hypothetical protein DF214_14145 [Pectobacterium atrosepticum]QXE14252.1 hypothetical protein DCX48_06835 [Pectobacterium atrosepticum]